jgi:hypothetical protein
VSEAVNDDHKADRSTPRNWSGSFRLVTCKVRRVLFPARIPAIARALTTGEPKGREQEFRVSSGWAAEIKPVALAHHANLEDGRSSERLPPGIQLIGRVPAEPHAL